MPSSERDKLMKEKRKHLKMAVPAYTTRRKYYAFLKKRSRLEGFKKHSIVGVFRNFSENNL